MTSFKTLKILIVEDQIIIADHILELLEEENFRFIKIANNEKMALKEMASFLPDVILMDINLNGINSGILLAEKRNTNASVIFITGQSGFLLKSKALKTNPVAYLTKPIKKGDILSSIRLVIKNRH